MKVLTSYPVVINNKRVSPRDYYLNADNQPTQQQIEEQKKKGLTWDKVKGTWVKAKESGLLDSIISFITPTQTAPVSSPPQSEPINTPAKEGLSKGAKIGLIVGGLAVVGAIIYFATKDKKTSKK
jgi:hypothetical protein